MPSLFHNCLALNLEIEEAGTIEKMRTIAAEILTSLGEDPADLERISSFVFDDRSIVIPTQVLRNRKSLRNCLTFLTEENLKRFVYDDETFRVEPVAIVRKKPVLT